MSGFLSDLQGFWASYYRYLKEEKRRESMTPKEYGMMLKKRGKKSEKKSEKKRK